MTQLVALPEGTELAGDYTIRRVLGAGGFGVTYLAEEKALGRMVSIKEYFPADFAARDDKFVASPRSQNCASDYNWGLDRFIEEAQTLAHFNHPNIVRVYRVFRANGTAYMVLHFEEGQSFKSWLKSLNRAPRQKEIDTFLPPLLDALEVIHKADFLHRDIAPDNIIVRKTGEPVLIDFGAARGELAAHSKTKTVSALVKPGYSPYEQYAESSRQQGPWTDIYALAATLYHAVAGKRPPDSPSRMLKDDMPPVKEAALASYRSAFLNAISNGLALKIDGRPQSICAWRGALLAPDPPKASMLSRLREQTQRRRTPSDEVKVDKPVDPTTAVPPPPDAPGPLGGLLDFVDALKSPAEGAPKEQKKTKPAPPKKSSKAPAAAAVQKKSLAKARKSKKADAATPVARKNKVAATPIAVNAKKRSKPRPDAPRRATGIMRQLVAKVAVAAAIGGLLIVYRDAIPQVLAPPNALTTGSIYSASADRQITERRNAKAHHSEITSLAYSGDGIWIVSTADQSSELKVWASDSLEYVGSIKLPNGPATSLNIKGDRIVTSHADGTAAVFGLSQRKHIASFKHNDAAIWSAVFVGGPDKIATASHDWSVTIWSVSSPNAPASVLSGHKNAVQAVAADDAGKWLATGSADRRVKLWSLDSGRLRRTFRRHSDFVSALAFSSDRRTLAAGSLDGAIRLWDRRTGRLLRRLRGHKSRITSIAFSPAGDLMASAAQDGSVRLRGISRRRMYWALGPTSGGARSVAFSPDGTTFLTGGRDGFLRLWSLPAAQLAHHYRN